MKQYKGKKTSSEFSALRHSPDGDAMRLEQQWTMAGKAKGEYDPNIFIDENIQFKCADFEL